MKLYTEFEVRKAIELARDTHQEGKPYLEKDEYDYSVDEIVNYLLTPIELPSDEEIDEIAFRRVNGLTDYLTPKELNCLREGYMNGMKLLINVIQGGNK